MKKVFLFFATLLALGQTSFAYDFSAVSPTGQTLYYRLASSNGEVAVTEPDYLDPKPAGMLTIPLSVTHNGTTYSVTAIDDYAFELCWDLTSVTIPSSVISIGYEAFSNCGSMTSVFIPNSVVSIGDGAFAFCSGLTSVTIPSSVASIGHGAFTDCDGLTSVSFNATNCTTMGSYYDPVFNGCNNLSTVVIGDAVTYIPPYAFAFCTGLTSVTIGEGVTAIDSCAFKDCISLSSVAFNATDCICMGTYSYSVFSGCSNFTTLTIGDNVTVIPNYAFIGCTGLTSVTVPSSVIRIWEYAFANCTGLTSITFNNGLRSIGCFAFSGCSGLVSVSIPNSVILIDLAAFQRCQNLTSVTICDSVSRIKEDAFYMCSSLDSVTIGSSVNYIGVRAFCQCSSLSSIICKADVPPTAEQSAFDWVSRHIPLYVPSASISSYQAAPVWHEFTNYQSLVGIDDVKNTNTKIYQCDNQVVVEGADGQTVTLYDANGHVQAIRHSGNQAITFGIPASGTYLVKVGNTPARKVVVVR